MDIAVDVENLWFLREIPDEASFWQRNLSGRGGGGAFCRLYGFDVLWFVEEPEKAGRSLSDRGRYRRPCRSGAFWVCSFVSAASRFYRPVYGSGGGVFLVFLCFLCQQCGQKQKNFSSGLGSNIFIGNRRLPLVPQ